MNKDGCRRGGVRGGTKAVIKKQQGVPEGGDSMGKKVVWKPSAGKSDAEPGRLAAMLVWQGWNAPKDLSQRERHCTHAKPNAFWGF